MKSIILLAVLALCHVSLGNPNGWASFQGRTFPGAEPVVEVTDVSDANDDNEAAVDINDQSSDDDSDDESRHQYEHGKDCDCKKLGNKSKPKITYGHEQIVKGKPETYIHHQPKIIVRQPPTHVRIEHPPTIIQPSTIVFHRNGKIIRKPVIYQHLPRDVRVRPVYIKVVKPIEKKVIVENKPHKPSYHSKDNLEYETTYGGRTYSENFDEREYEKDQDDSNNAGQSQKYKPSHGGLSYSASYEENEHEYEQDKSKSASVSLESKPSGLSYSASQEESEHEYEHNKSKSASESLEYQPSYGGRSSDSESFDDGEDEYEQINSKPSYDGPSFSESYEENEREREELNAHYNIKEKKGCGCDA